MIEAHFPHVFPVVCRCVAGEQSLLPVSVQGKQGKRQCERACAVGFLRDSSCTQSDFTCKKSVLSTGP